MVEELAENNRVQREIFSEMREQRMKATNGKRRASARRRKPADAKQDRSGLTMAEAFHGYIAAIEQGRPSDDDNAINRELKAIYQLGGGDFEKGAARLMERQDEQLERDRRDSPALDILLVMQQSENPVHRMLVEFILRGGMKLPSEAAWELQTMLLDEEVHKSARQLPTLTAGTAKSPGQSGGRGATTPTSPRTAALNRLAIMWVRYNQNERMSRDDDMKWFLGEYAKAVGLNYVSMSEFKKHLPKAYEAGLIDKDEKARRYTPKVGT